MPCAVSLIVGTDVCASADDTAGMAVQVMHTDHASKPDFVR
jgi:hypothetical protein